MTRQQRRKLEREMKKRTTRNTNMKTRIDRYLSPKETKTEIMSVKEVMEIPCDPNFQKRHDRENELKQQEKFKGKRPIECLEINGYKVVRKPEKENQILIYIGESDNIFECIDQPKIDIFSPHNNGGLYFFDERLIKDYSSLWVLTDTGWFSNLNEIYNGKTNQLYPYIVLESEKHEGEYISWRWDNNHFLRVNCLTHNWDEENFNLCKKYLSGDYEWVSKYFLRKKNSIMK